MRTTTTYTTYSYHYGQKIKFTVEDNEDECFDGIVMSYDGTSEKYGS